MFLQVPQKKEKIWDSKTNLRKGKKDVRNR